MGPDSIRFWVLFLDQNGDLNRDRKGALIWGPFLVPKMGTCSHIESRFCRFMGTQKCNFFGSPNLVPNASPFPGARVRRVGSMAAALHGC